MKKAGKEQAKQLRLLEAQKARRDEIERILPEKRQQLTELSEKQRTDTGRIVEEKARQNERQAQIPGACEYADLCGSGGGRTIPGKPDGTDSKD